MNIQKQKIAGPKNNNFIGCWDINNEELLKDIINYFNQNSKNHMMGVTGSGLEDFDSKKSIDLAVRPTEINKKENKFLQNYFSNLNTCFRDYCKDWVFLERMYDSFDIGVFNIQKYEQGGHFKAWHCERSSLNHSNRIFAWMTYLNTVEKGGTTDFLHYDIAIKPKVGRTLIWPAEWTHAHRGGEVFSEKYIITGWIEFPIPKN